MKFSVHLAVSVVLAALFYPVFGINSFFIIIGGLFPDIDHYLHFVFMKKRFNPFECNNYYTEEAKKRSYHEFDGVLFIFHTLEFLILMMLLSFYSKLAFIFTIGIAGHFILDAIWFTYFVRRLVLNHSIISWLIIKSKKLK